MTDDQFARRARTMLELLPWIERGLRDHATELIASVLRVTAPPSTAPPTEAAMIAAWLRAHGAAWLRDQALSTDVDRAEFLADAIDAGGWRLAETQKIAARPGMVPETGRRGTRKSDLTD
jgi:hypothetical protein